MTLDLLKRGASREDWCGKVRPIIGFVAFEKISTSTSGVNMKFSSPPFPLKICPHFLPSFRPKR